jgi:lysozyme
MRVPGLLAILGACFVLAGCGVVTGGATPTVQSAATDDTASIAGMTAPLPPALVNQPGRRSGHVDTQQDAPADPLQDASQPRRNYATLGAPPSRPIDLPSRPAAIPVALGPADRPLLRQRIYSHRFRDAKPMNFGKASPRVFAVHGVDVSRWQGEIDWQTLRQQGANFVFIKATDGGDHLDPMFRRNWQAAHDAGLRRGAYHFFYWCRNAAEQARWFIRNVPRVNGALPPVVDVEWNADSACKARLTAGQVQDKMRVFINMVEAYYGQRPIIYTAPGFYHDNLEGAFMDYPFWLRSVAQHPAQVFENRKWIFWQYSGSGLSQGVDGKIDLNVFNGSADAWYRWVSSNAGADRVASVE